MSTNGFTQYGDQTYQFGLPSGVLTLIPGMALTSLKKTIEPEFIATAEGAKGLAPAVALGDDMETHEGSGILISETDFKANKTYTYQGRLFIFTKKGEAYEHGTFSKCDFSTKSWSLITPSTP